MSSNSAAPAGGANPSLLLKYVLCAPTQLGISLLDNHLRLPKDAPRTGAVCRSLGVLVLSHRVGVFPQTRSSDKVGRGAPMRSCTVCNLLVNSRYNAWCISGREHRHGFAAHRQYFYGSALFFAIDFPF